MISRSQAVRLFRRLDDMPCDYAGYIHTGAYTCPGHLDCAECREQAARHIADLLTGEESPVPSAEQTARELARLYAEYSD